MLKSNKSLDVSSAAATARLRQAVIANVRRLTRVVMVTSEETARLICYAHDIASHAAGRGNDRPPPDYVPPSRE